MNAVEYSLCPRLCSVGRISTGGNALHPPLLRSTLATSSITFGYSMNRGTDSEHTDHGSEVLVFKEDLQAVKKGQCIRKGIHFEKGWKQESRMERETRANKKSQKSNF
uniref:Uncharacterized protein n=1 Tax=Eutreptiella gymnastica TaxID=73025 RepID=A0A6T2GNG3_9EUGL